MPRFKSTVILVALILAGFLAASEAGAFFPEKEVTLWDSRQARADRNNPVYTKIHELAGQKKYAEALVLAEEAAQANPEKGTPLILKALLLNELGRFQEGYEILQQGREIQRRHPAIQFGHCQFYRHLGVVDLAERACVIAVEQHPESAAAHFEYAETLAAMGDMAAANRELEESARIDPGNALFPFQQGMNWMYLNRLDNAEKAFQRAQSLDGENQEAAYQLGYLHAIQNQPEKARTYLNPIWENHRGHAKAEAARQLLELIQKNQAGQLPRQVIPAQYHLSRFKSLYKSGNFGDAFFEIQTAYWLNPGDPATQEIMIGLSSLLLRLDVAEKAVETWIDASAADPGRQARGYQELGDIHVLRGRLGEARGFYQKSLDLGDPAQIAKISLEELPAEDPDGHPPFNANEYFHDPAEALNRKGEVFAHYKMFERAMAIYATVLQINPNHLGGKLNSATAYYHTGKFDRAINLLERTLVVHPEHALIVPHRVLLAKCYARKNDSDGAIKSLEWIREHHPEVLATLRSDPVFAVLRDHAVFR